LIAAQNPKTCFFHASATAVATKTLAATAMAVAKINNNQLKAACHCGHAAAKLLPPSCCRQAAAAAAKLPATVM
jgi:hypothetical protein